ncbi:hypothetical protein E2C01_048395 [Portunus trituberculatus]|uniref:Uncharacterized protein n=1 Tax=Portunus trituberculatus TaxID=210409 RepID=A0A5B7GAL1_PORTR|nr:hypothetical protein [Portunus trituberculatus]
MEITLSTLVFFLDLNSDLLIRNPERSRIIVFFQPHISCLHTFDTGIKLTQATSYQLSITHEGHQITSSPPPHPSHHHTHQHPRDSQVSANSTVSALPWLDLALVKPLHFVPKTSLAFLYPLSTAEGLPWPAACRVILLLGVL